MKKLLSILMTLALSAFSASAQNQKNTSKMLYHGGPVLTGIQDIYVIWYGCWNSTCGIYFDPQTHDIVADFLITIGNSPYAQINSTYKDASAQPAASSFIYGGSVLDGNYAYGTELTRSGIESMLADKFNSGQLPEDPNGIYIVIGSADISSNEAGFCVPSAPPFHTAGIIHGGYVRYMFLGHPNRCPSLAGPWFSPSGPTPNGNYAGDVLVANLVHALNGLVTNPLGNAWFDRYGLENTDKCVDASGQPSFGQTYLTANGARANIKLGLRDFLLPQNLVNDRKGRCAMSL